MVTREEFDALVAGVAKLKAQVDSLNEAVMDREGLREIASGPIDVVRDAVAKLEED